MSGHVAWPATNTTTQYTTMKNDKHPSQIIEAKQSSGSKRDQATHGISGQNTTPSYTSMQGLSTTIPITSMVAFGINHSAEQHTKKNSIVPLASQRKYHSTNSVNANFPSNRIGRSHKQHGWVQQVTQGNCSKSRGCSNSYGQEGLIEAQGARLPRLLH